MTCIEAEDQNYYIMFIGVLRKTMAATFVRYQNGKW